MNCANCGFANDADAEFCENCGAALARACGNCGSPLKPGARFCKKCGAAVSQPSGPVSPPTGTGEQGQRLAALRQAAPQALRDKIRAASLYQAADRILIEEAAVIPLTYTRYHMLVKPWISHFRLSPMRWWHWKDVVIEPH